MTVIPTGMDCRDEDEAYHYALRSQIARRNLSDADILRLLPELDRRMTKTEAGAPVADGALMDFEEVQACLRRLQEQLA